MQVLLTKAITAHAEFFALAATIPHVSKLT